MKKHSKPLKVITLGKMKSYDINRFITITLSFIYQSLVNDNRLMLTLTNDYIKRLLCISAKINILVSIDQFPLTVTDYLTFTVSRRFFHLFILVNDRTKMSKHIKRSNFDKIQIICGKIAFLQNSLYKC